MTLQEIFEESKKLKEILKHEVGIFCNIEYDKENPEECFLFSYARTIESEIEYIIESIAYIHKPIVLSGSLILKDGIPHIDEFELRESDAIEVFMDGEWQQIEIIKIKGKFLGDFFETRQGISARIRLSQEDIALRPNASISI